jgi:hypothetical protein
MFAAFVVKATSKSTEVLGLGEMVEMFKGEGSAAEMFTHPVGLAHLCRFRVLFTEHLYSR